MTRLVPMTGEDFAAWHEGSIAGYAEENVKSGRWSKEEAPAKARGSFAELLPNGLATPRTHLFNVVDDAGQNVGMLWINEQDRSGERIAFVYDIMIHPQHRRRGHAQSALALLEEKAKEMGLSGVGLHVFGHNQEARALYEKTGFAATSIQMFKRIAS